MKNKKKYAILVIIILVAAAVVAAGLIYTKQRNNHPVWNDVRLDIEKTKGYSVGDDWDETFDELENAGFATNGYYLNMRPSKDGAFTGVRFRQSVDGKSVHSIYCDIEDIETGRAVFLMDISLDQATYGDLEERIGEANKKREVGNGNVFYVWVEGDKILEVEADGDDNLLNIYLGWPYEE